MIALSSIRPHAEDADYAANQIRARRSWDDCFERVYYFGKDEPSLHGTQVKTYFIAQDGWPTIREMANYASCMTTGYVAILNADLVISPLIVDVERYMSRIGLPAATSYRYEFDMDNNVLPIESVRNKQDRGMDIFIATPQIWRLVARAVPTYLRIGHQTWDTWVCGFFCSQLGLGFQQFTDKRVIFHPKHGGRKTPHQVEIRNDHPCFTLAHQPPAMAL